MSDKLTAIKIKQPDGTYSDQILISVLAENVRYDATKGLIDQLNYLDGRISNIIAASSGSVSTQLDQHLIDIKVGNDGVTYNTPGDAVRANDQKALNTVLVQSSQPTAAQNKLWIQQTNDDEIEILTIDDLTNVVAAQYDNQGTYTIGDYVLHEGGFYRCKVTIDTAENWTSGHWDQVTVGSELGKAGGSVQEEVTDLKSVIGDIDSELTDGIFVQYANGEETSVQSYSCTDYIPCVGMKIYVKTETANDTSGIAFYDEAKNYVSGFNPYSNNYTLFELDIPDTAVYVRISCLVRYKASFIVECRDFLNQTAIRIGSIESNISAQSEAISKLNSIKNDSENILPISGKSVTFSGVTMSYDDGVITYNGTATGSGGKTLRLITPMTLSAGTYTLWAENGIAQIFIENATGNTIITSIAAGNAWKSTFTLESETTLYIGSNVDNGTTYSNRTVNVMLESGSTKTEYEAPSYATAVDHTARDGLKALDRFWAYAMQKILCIGDSLTSGACWSGAWNGASIDQNYPRLLGRMLDAETTNAGVSGLTASQWYKNEISKYNLADYDTFIIWLGTNSGLTDTLDTDVDPYTDYTDFADTNTGNYCKIIEKIKADNPDCLIILTKVFVSNTTNVVIDKIALKYGLPVVDNSDLTVANYPELHGNINNPHFTKPGNLVIANRYVTTLADVFAENPALANYGLTARAN